MTKPTNWQVRPELQIRGGIEDNSWILFLYLKDNICDNPSLEQSRRDGSNDGSQNIFFIKIY